MAHLLQSESKKQWYAVVLWYVCELAECLGKGNRVCFSFITEKKTPSKLDSSRKRLHRLITVHLLESIESKKTLPVHPAASSVLRPHKFEVKIGWFFFFTWLSIDIITKVDSHDLVLEKFLSVIITLSLSSLGRIGEGGGGEFVLRS